MKKNLPIIFGLLLFSLFIFAFPASAQITPTAIPTVSVIPSPTLPPEPKPVEGDWIIDPEVTSIGKNASRSGLLLDWALRDYDWSFATPGTTHPLIPFWVTIRNIVYSMLIVLVVAAAIVMLVTRGRSLTIRRFIPRFIIVAILVTFSFVVVQFLYEVVDLIQAFFIRPGGQPISQRDLLFIGWNYQPFVGLRQIGDTYNESAFVTLLLTKFTAFTYFCMVGILLVRKIILWFFIIVSPLFPLLLFFYPVRNTAKIWVGEFFRWLLYAPLFAIFLAGLVSLWKLGIPLFFNFANVSRPGDVVFPTAVSILLGGPGQIVSPTNSVSTADTYAQYIVALLMLWVVIIMPFILLQIFLDHLQSVNVNNNAFLRQLVNYVNKLPLQPTPGGNVPPSSSPGGIAKTLPFLRDFTVPGQPPSNTGLAREIPRDIKTEQITSSPVAKKVNEKIQQMTNLSVPTIRDVARFDATSITKDRSIEEKRDRVRETLSRIANPQAVSAIREREKYQSIRDSLVRESTLGNTFASSIMQAATNIKNQAVSTQSSVSNTTKILNQLANPNTVSNTTLREKLVILKEKLVTLSQQGNTLATTVLSTLATVEKESVSNLERVLTRLAAPAGTDRYSTLKETLVRESEKGNASASTIISAVRQIERSSATRESLTNIASQSQIQDISEKEKFAELKRELLSKKEEGDTFASTFLSQIERLSQATNSADQEKVMQEIRSEVIREQKAGNPVAVYIINKIPSVAEDRGNLNAQEIKIQLEKARQDGDSVASQLLTLLSSMQDTKTSNVEILLQKLAGTTDSLSEEERGQYESLKETIVREQSHGNPIATLLMQIIHDVQVVQDTRHTLLSINNIDQVPQSDRSRIVQLRDRLVSDKERNTLARSVLNNIKELQAASTLTQQTTVIMNLRSELQTAKDQNNGLATFLLSQLQGLDTLTQARQINKINERLKEAGEKGDPLANDLLSKTENTKENEDLIQNLLTRLEEAKTKGDPLANEVNSLLKPATESISVKPESFPTTNRIQEVSLDDYEAVKKMWTENYEKMEVPGQEDNEGVRSQYIEQDVSQIAETISLLTSNDPEKVSEGMQEVSDILPFLLIGGFSQQEIVAYLRAKQEAGKSVLSQIKKTQGEDETLLDTQSQKKSEPQVMTMKTAVSPVDKVVKNDRTQSILSDAPKTQVQIQTSQLPLLKAANISIPNLLQIASIDSSSITNNKKHIEEKDKLARAIDLIANPSKASSVEDQSRFKQLKESLASEVKTNNPVADAFTKATTLVSSAESDDQEKRTHDFVEFLQNLGRPDSISDASKKDEFKKLKKNLEFEQNTNDLARLILTTVQALITQDVTNMPKIEDVYNTLDQAARNGDPLAVDIRKKLQTGEKEKSDTTSPLATVTLPSENKVQAVSLDDYEAVRQMWTDAYKKQDVPQGSGSVESRRTFLRAEIYKLSTLETLLTSSDSAKVHEGIEHMLNIMPFLLVGGFTKEEIVSYVKAKLEAAKAVLSGFDEPEELSPKFNPPLTKSDKEISREIDE